MKSSVDKKTIKTLKKAAKLGAQNSYAPYSRIKVGAALLTKSGEVIHGGNVENISYGGTICAERSALVKAVSEGHTKFAALYLYTKEQWSPCGICLQFMSEFFSPETPIFLGSKDKETEVKLKDLLPQKLNLATFKKLQK
jgi:cytidine deaminase